MLAVLLLLAQTSTPPLRIVDATTGQALEGVEVIGTHEVPCPVWGETWTGARWITDQEGFARNAPGQVQQPVEIFVVRAPGYGIQALTAGDADGESPVQVGLRRALPARIRMVDFLGRPLPLVHLGYCVHCGHTPDVAWAVTGTDGWATLDFVGPEASRDIADLYPVGEGVRTDYLDFDWTAAQGRGDLAIAEPGTTLCGRLVLHDGAPAAGFYVGDLNRHRGPWTRTDALGGFRLQGVPAAHVKGLMIADPDGEHWTDVGESRVGVERLIQLGPKAWDSELIGGVADRSTGKLMMTVTLAALGEAVADAWPEPKVPVEVWDPATGWSALREVTPGEPREITLHAGVDYEVEVGGKGSPVARRSLGRLRLAPDAVEERTFEVAPPRVAIVSVDLEGEASHLAVWTGNGVVTHVDPQVITTREVAGSTAIFEPFVVPAESHGLWLLWKDDDRPKSRVVVTGRSTREDGVELWNARVDTSLTD